MKISDDKLHLIQRAVFAYTEDLGFDIEELDEDDEDYLETVKTINDAQDAWQDVLTAMRIAKIID